MGTMLKMLARLLDPPLDAARAAGSSPAGGSTRAPDVDRLRTYAMVYEEVQRISEASFQLFVEPHMAAAGCFAQGTHDPVGSGASTLADAPVEGEALGLGDVPPAAERLTAVDAQRVDGDVSMVRLTFETLRRAVIRHPVAAQALFGSLVREGRRYAATDEGRRWAEALSRSEVLRSARENWEAATLNVLDGSGHDHAAQDPQPGAGQHGGMPSTYLEALLRAYPRSHGGHGA